VKELLVMCTSEHEQKQWIAKLSKKIPKRGVVSQHDQTTSSRFVRMILTFFFPFSKTQCFERNREFPIDILQEKTEMDFTSIATIITILSNHSYLNMIAFDKFPN
jgi:hypothetical protein